MLDFITKEPINKGWSCDRKYRVTTAVPKCYIKEVETWYEKQ